MIVVFWYTTTFTNLKFLWALYRALEDRLNVTRLLTVHPSEESDIYHVPVTQLARLAAEMPEADFVITILQTAADAVDESRFGRPLNAIDELGQLNQKYGVHLLGAVGEFETVVTNRHSTVGRRVEPLLVRQFRPHT